MLDDLVRSAQHMATCQYRAMTGRQPDPEAVDRAVREVLREQAAIVAAYADRVRREPHLRPHMRLLGLTDMARVGYVAAVRLANMRKGGAT